LLINSSFITTHSSLFIKNNNLRSIDSSLFATIIYIKDFVVKCKIPIANRYETHKQLNVLIKYFHALHFTFNENFNHTYNPNNQGLIMGGVLSYLYIEKNIFNAIIQIN
jgi:hypothetical protein